MNRTCKSVLIYGVVSIVLAVVLFFGLLLAGYYLDMRKGPSFQSLQSAVHPLWRVLPDSASFADSKVDIGTVIQLHTQLRANGFYQPQLRARIQVPEGLLLKGEPQVDMEYAFGHYLFEVTLRLQPIRPGTYDSMVLELEGTRSYAVDFDANAIPEPRLNLALPALYARLPDTAPDSAALAGEAVLESEPGIPRFLFFLLGGVLLCAVALALYFGLKRKKSMPVVSYRDVARMHLRELREALVQGHVSPERIFSQLSDVVRQYLTRRFHVAFTTQTSEEFFQSLAQTDALAGTQQQALHDFIQAADRVKFAGMKADSSQVNSAIDGAEHLIDQTPEAEFLPGGEK